MPSTPGGLLISDSTKRQPKTQSKSSSTSESELFDLLEDNDYEGEAGAFDLDRAKSIVDEDSLNPDYQSASIVEVAEEVLMDSVWISIAEYYAIWDSRRVNPYRIDPTKRLDTIGIQLFDNQTKYMGWAMPGENLYPTSRFGPRGIRYHYGIDLRVKVGDSIRAAFGGIVRMANFDKRGYGKYVLVRHYNGLETLYAHLSNQQVKVGQYVDAGDVIGLGGNTGRSTGPHLHFEVRYEGNPLNPEYFYDFERGAIIKDFFYITPAHYEYLREMRKAVYHKIRPGDTLSGIARRYGVKMSSIARLNRISTKTILRVGRRLRIR